MSAPDGPGPEDVTGGRFVDERLAEAEAVAEPETGPRLDAGSQSDDRAEPTMGARAARGGLQTMVGQGSKLLVQVVSVVALSHLLSPHQYGLVAMVMAVIGVADVFRDFGLSSAAIQAKTLSRAEQSNLFWTNTAIGVVLAVIIFAAAPLLVMIYHEPLLLTMTHALAASFVLNGMATQYRADLSRRLKFAWLTLSDVIAAVVALVVTVLLALGGAGQWALVAQQLTQYGTMLVLVVVFARWLPGRFRRTVSIRPFLSFGWKLAGSQLINYVGNNTDSLTIGTRFGASALGLYNRSFQLLMTPLGQLRGPLNTVAIPVLAQLQTDEKRFGRYLIRGQLMMGYTIVAGLAVVVGGAEPIVRTFLGPQWSGTTPILRLLALAGIFQTLSYAGYWVYVSRGLVGELLKYSLISTGIRVICILTGSIWGVTGVAAGYAVAPAIAWPLSLWWLSRRAHISTRSLTVNGYRLCGFAGVIAVVAAVGEHLGAGLPGVLQLVLAVVGGALGYAVLGLAVPAFRRELGEVIGSIGSGLRRRR